AIERARAKKAAQQAGGEADPPAVSPLESLRQKLAKSEQRLAQGREAGEDAKIITALEASVKRLQGKIAEAEAAAADTVETEARE
ncbi:MAG: electron transport complex subunit RsxC, partial [Haliea sp.]